MPRAGLDSTRVIQEAEVLADEVGIANVTLAAIAARLGVKVPSLYKHIDGLDALQHQIAVRARAELTTVFEDAAAGGLPSLATAYRSWAHEHPGRYPAILRAPSPDDSVDLAISARAIDVIYGILAEFGITDDEAIDATRMLRSALHGFVSLEAAGGFGLPQDVDRSFERMVGALMHTIGELAPT
jgi:AcrR family transcriptional regulator